MRQKTSILKRCYLFVASIVSSVLFIITPASAASGSTTVTQVLTPGLLAFTSSPTATMNGVTLNGTGSQLSTGSLGLMTVTDARGTSAGWSLTATCTAFSKVGVPTQTVGSIGALTTAGSYTSATPGTYTVTIGTGGALGTSTYSVSGLETQAASATGAAVALGTRGLNLTFAAANYVTGEQWTIAVDTIPASNLTITPSAATVVSGSGTGVTSGAAYTYSTGNDPAPIMSASNGSGLGSYTNNPSLSLNIPAGTKSGSYAATITETVN